MLTSQELLNLTPPAVEQFSRSLAAPVAIAKIGGSIREDYTDLDTGVTLIQGTYVVTVDAAFESAQVGDREVEVYPQVSLWTRTPDGVLMDDESSISPNAIMPVAANRPISTSGITRVTVTEDDTHLGLVAFGYASTEGGEREINVVRAVVTALRVIAE